MKGQMWTYGGILLSIILLSIFMIKVSVTDDVERGIVSSEGKMNSFVNYADLLMRMLNTSIEFIAQRAAYDLGENGGLIKEAYWTSIRPSMDELKRSLEMTIKDRLPYEGTTDAGRSILWGDSYIKVSEDTSICGSTENSKCFFVKGEKNLQIYEGDIDTRISFSPYKIYIKIDSNYLRLLNAGRAIMEETLFRDLLDEGDLTTLLQELQSDSRFSDLYLTAEDKGGAVEINISERCFPPDTYCLSPLKPGETGELSIPYDYNKLSFKVGVSATPATCDGTVALDCDVPGFEHDNDERLWGDYVCGRNNALIDCDGTEGSKKVCNIDGFCEKMDPIVNYYTISDLSINVGDQFTMFVNSNCFSGLPGKCLVECRVVHPDGHFIELDSWSEDGIVTMPPVTCNQAGDYIVDYCLIVTDFYKNGGWGERKDTDIIVSCS